jgi:predicted MFS family arabinose efflux permease
VFLIIGGFSGALAPDYWSFVASRVIVGFAIPGIQINFQTKAFINLIFCD